MAGVQTIAVVKDETDMRLDRWFKSHFPGVKHGALEKMLRTGQIRVDGKRVKANSRLANGQQVRVPPLPDDSTSKAPQAGTPGSKLVKQGDSEPNGVGAVRGFVGGMREEITSFDAPQRMTYRVIGGMMHRAIFLV